MVHGLIGAEPLENVIAFSSVVRCLAAPWRCPSRSMKPMLL